VTSPEGTLESNGTVLLIDDEDTLRLAVVKMLRRKGFVVFEAADGRTGMDLFRTHAGTIDAVLLDVTLPGISGRVVFSRVRKMRPDVKIILTTAHPRERALASVGADESCLYIRKPYQLGDLAELLRRVCHKPHHDSANG
jgi:DNA-binding response OmpR family regulator